MKRFLVMLMVFQFLLGACTSDDSLFKEEMPKVDNPYFVRIEEAIEKADDFFALLDTIPATRTPRIVKNIELYRSGSTLTRSSNDNPDFYIINYENDRGFALMSTDSRKVPVYAFATEGHMNLSDTINNPGLRNYLSASTYISSIGIDTLCPYNPPSIVEGTLKVLVPPMLPKQAKYWDQLSLNKYVCPNPEDSIPVGCVALATAQIMSYFQWPNRWPVDGYNSAKERYEFDWQKMLGTRVNDKTARLLEILGRPEYLNMRYKKLESSTSQGLIIPTMRKMGFKNLRIKNELNSDTAISMLYKKSPLIMTGFPIGQTGHAWTVDGVAQYKEPYHKVLGESIYRIYYHFIWGNWGGSNGYFYFDDSLRSFEDHAREFDKEDTGHGNIGSRHSNINIIIDFQVDLSKLN